MSIRYKCEECGSVLTIKDELAGTKGRCPKCKAAFIVPAAPAPVSEGEKRAAGVGGAPAEPPTGAIGGKTPLPGTLSDDDIEDILEGKGAPVETGGYRVAVAADDDYDDDDDDDDDAAPRSAPVAYRKQDEDDDGDGMDAPAVRVRRKSDKTPPPQPAVSVANVARDLMARGEKAAKSEKAADDKRGGRPFGGDERGAAADDEFSLADKLIYVAKIGGPVVLIVALISAAYMWWFSSWQRGTLPGLAPVSGTVTLDGQPVNRALVQFIPLFEEKEFKKALTKGAGAAGYTDEMGRYTLFYTTVTGAVVGRNKVRIDATDDLGRPLIPSQYNIQSTLTADVPEGGKTFDWDLESDDSNVMGKGKRPQPGSIMRPPVATPPRR
ncbi:MAG: hypothetical protein ACT4QC_10015 [Planctomycetaceae bacterium]